MIGNQTKGRGFRGLLNYLENQKDAKLIGGNMGGNNAPVLAREFKISRQLNPEADRVVYHASLSLPENERLDEATWNEIANRYLEEMGFDSNQYVVYRHSNTEHDHIHICASRIRLDNGKIVHDSWDYKRSETIIRQLERDYSLQQTHSSHEKLSRNSSIGQQKRLQREQLEYINGKRQTQQERPIKEQLQELIDRAAQDKLTMPQLVERLQLQGVEVRHGLTRNGKSKGISYSWNDQKFSGTSLGAAYTFPGLQKHKGIDYQPQRDDERIEHLLKNPKQQAVESQRFINTISDFIEQSVVDDALVETLPQLTEQLFGYWQQLKASKTAFNDFETALTAELQSHAEKRAILSISDYVEQSVIESALTQTVLGLTEQISQYKEQLKAGRTTFDDLEAVIVYLEQLQKSQRIVDANALNKPQTSTTDKPKLTPNQTAELYNYYSADLQNLLVTDRDKEIAMKALLDNKPAQDVEEIILASPAGWTTDEAKALVLIANNQLASNREQKQSLPQFTPPPEDESLRPVLQYYLTHTRALTNFLVQPLQRQGLAYIDQQENVVFIKRDLDGEKSGALVWDTARLDNRCTEYPKNSDRQKGWFHLKLGGEADDKIERVYLCSSPIDALTMAEIDRSGHKGQPSARTMYMAVDDPNNLPVEFLKKVSRIGLAFNNDSQGNETAQAVQKMLPQAKRIEPSGLTWNEILIEAQQKEMLSQKQRSRGFSR